MMRITGEKYLSAIVVGVVVITTQTISIVRAECQTSAVQTNPTDSNGCSYPACIPNASSFTNPSQLTCVHDSSFCASNERFVPAVEVLAAGRLCSCKDILNYPALIGTCSTNNLFSPMVSAGDCLEGTAVCEQDWSSGKFLTGDAQHPFTACDLKCDTQIGHEIAVSGDTYKDCSFPKFDWTVASKSEFYNLQADQFEIVGNELYIGGTIVPLNKCYVDGAVSDNCVGPTNFDATPLTLRHLLKGPFDASNPSSENGDYITDTINGNPARICAIASVDKTNGKPRGVYPLYGTGSCYVESMVTASGRNGNGSSIGGKLIVAGGYHTAMGQLGVQALAECVPVSNRSGGAATVCENGVTIVKAHDQADTAFVILMDPEIRMVHWIIQPWLAIIDNEAGGNSNSYYSASVTDSSIDEYGDVYISGYRIELLVENPKKYAIISKHSKVDGSVLWEREFPEVRGIRLVQEGEALYITLQIPRSMAGTSVLGIICNPTLLAVQMCNILARISSIDGSLEWARYTPDGISHNTTNFGEVKLAHPDDGPYVYATFSSGVTSNLDLGTPYAGCRTNEGDITIETDPIFSNIIIPLNPTACTFHGRGIYFDRTSEYALPANFSNTRAQCRWNHSGTHCLVKYHKLSGLPIWGSVTPLSQDFQPTADGIIMTGSHYGPVTFDTVEISGPDSLGGGHSIVYQSKIDLDGAGVYVQPIVAHQSSATAAGLTQDPDTGDIYIGFSTEASETYLGPGAPVGFIQDLELKAECKDTDTLCTEVSRLIVAKLGLVQKPDCIDSCGDGGNVIKNGMCFIDQVCYMGKDTGTRIGLPCHVCNPSISQTEWMDDIDNFCVIDSMCHKAGDHLTVDGTKSVCQLCLPERNNQAWSVDNGYERRIQDRPPFDCMPIVSTLSPRPATTTDDYDYYHDDLFPHSSDDDDSISADSSADGEDSRPGSKPGRVAAAVIASIFIVVSTISLILSLCFCCWCKPEKAPVQFLRMEADLT